MFIATFQVLVKMAVAVERFLHIQEVCCDVLLEENEVSKNEFDFLCCSYHSEDCLLFAIRIKGSDVSDSIGQ